MPKLKIRQEILDAVPAAPPIRLKGSAKDSQISPELLATLGGAADAASTYRFMKNKTGTEENAMFKGMGPAATALGVAGTSLGMSGLRSLLRKKFPKLADVLAANQGARQIGLAAENLSPGSSADQRVTSKLQGASGAHPLPEIPLIPYTKNRFK